MTFSQIKSMLKAKQQFFDSNDYEDVLNKIKKAEEFSLSQKPTEEAIAEAEKHKLKGNEHYKNKDFYEAIYSYTNAIELDPNNPVYYSNRSAAYASLNMNENGIDDCLKAIEIDISYVKAYVRLGDFYAVTDIDKSREYYQQALKLDPKNTNIQRKLDNLRTERVNEKNDGNNFNNMNFEEILKNPEYMKAAQEMMKGKSKEELMEMLKNMPKS